MSTRAESDIGQTGREIARIVYSQEEIRQRVSALAEDITLVYGPQDRLLVLGLLKGSFIFLADLVRQIKHPLQVDFLVASSYGKGKRSSGKVDLLYDPEASLKGRSVILVEDIIDSGATMNRLLPLLERREPSSLEVCALLHKRVATLEREPRWVGFNAPLEFLVGYGLDYGEEFRHLPFIGTL